MKDYRSLETAAKHVQTTEATLIEFRHAGWIEFVSKEGHIYISSQDEYRCRFILHLRRKLGLSDNLIGIVLARAKAPYSQEQVADILGQHRPN
ncbi:MAG TPA: hypothetical protein VHY84_07775 [Bryobacteraceae bacterium]|nr:hypothetical protein [Bryobacteraceae bacterium]